MPPFHPPRDLRLHDDVPRSRSTGAPTAPTGARRLLVLHGGPGADHQYLLPQMLDLAETTSSSSTISAAAAARAPMTRRRSRGRPTSKTSPRVAQRARLPIRSRSSATRGAGCWRCSTRVRRRVHATGPRFPFPIPDSLALIDPAPINSTSTATQFEAEFARRQQGAAVQRFAPIWQSRGFASATPTPIASARSSSASRAISPIPQRAHDLTPFRVVGRVQQSVWGSLGDFDLRSGAGARERSPP